MQGYKLRRDPNSGIIYMHWTDSTARGKPGRSRRMSTHTADSNEAEKALARFLAAKSAGPGRVTKCPWCGAVANGSPADPASDNTAEARVTGASSKKVIQGSRSTVGELWAIYIEKHIRRNAASPQTMEKTWVNLGPHFDSLKVSEVSQDVVDAYEDRRKRGAIGRPSVSATIRRELAGLQACFNWCASPKCKALSREELPVFDLPAGSEPRDRWLRTEEIDRLKAAAADLSRETEAAGRMSRGERFLWIGLETAARSEAIRELTWDRVDWETKVIDFNVPGRRRTKKRRAVVPISKALEPVLRRMEETAINRHVLDNDSEVLKLVHRIAERAGVEGVTPHVLRHTAATNMARRGVPLFLVAKILANSSEMVERVYAKHQPDDLREAIEKI